jgi:hypothetical protein
MSRKILAQGDRDGACFLYSIANSYSALTSKQLSRDKWRKSINAIPFRIDDFLSGRGTEKLDDNLEYFEGLCRDFLSNEFEVTGKMNVSEKSLRAHITEDQVAIVAIENGAHWVCIVDVDNELFYIACSAAALESQTKYTEEKSLKLERFYNSKLSFTELKLWNSYALLINKTSEA